LEGWGENIHKLEQQWLDIDAEGPGGIAQATNFSAVADEMSGMARPSFRFVESNWEPRYLSLPLDGNGFSLM
jgi:hypothetical protein